MAVEDSLDIFGADPFGRDVMYGLSTGREPLGLAPPPQGLPVDTRPYDQMQATPRGFISGLFSDVLGRTMNMPSLPRTGIPSLDLLYANRNPVFNMMGVGDVQKTAERISYGEPLTTGAGMTLRPRDETIGAAMTVAPFVGEAAVLGARAGRTGARMIGQEIADRVATGQSILPSGFAEPRSSLFAVEPNPMAASKPQAPVSELGFYSAAEQAALNLPRNKGTGQAFLNDLMKAPDVKKDELAWTGLDDFLKDKPNVTKQEVQDYLASNKVDLQEVRLGEQPPYDKIRLATLENELSQLKEHPIDAPTFGEEKFNELLKLQNIRDQSTVDSLYSGAEVAIRNAQRAQAAGNKELANKYFLESEMFNTRAEALDLQGLGVPNPTQYSKYQLAGGENYREILLKLPFKEPAMPKGYEVTSMQYDDGTVRYFANTPTTRSQGFRTQEEAQAELSKTASNLKGFRENLVSYQSSHFNEPNILAHIRVNDRVDADGKKMLLVEEIQSDWHQAGREVGYKTGKERTPAQVEKELTITTQKRSRLIDEAAALPDSEMTKFKAMNEEIKALGEQATKLNEEWTNLLNKPEGVPDAPFKDTWYQLALKRIMKYAADNGYERVGLTTGKRQIDRFSDELRQNVDEINFFSGYPNKETTTISATKNGQLTFEGTVVNGKFIDGAAKDKSIDEVLGKSIAQKIQSHDPSQGLGTIKGDDLTIGGEGMKKYYDEIYPKFLEKYGKKWDAGVGETTIATDRTRDAQGIPSMYPTKEPIRYIDITPKMKESVGKGQPLFTAIPAGTLGLGGLEYADPFASPLAEDTTR
jgi:hypothetical protein